VGLGQFHRREGLALDPVAGVGEGEVGEVRHERRSFARGRALGRITQRPWAPGRSCPRWRGRCRRSCRGSLRP
jgi:hypothetical protein